MMATFRMLLRTRFILFFRNYRPRILKFCVLFPLSRYSRRALGRGPHFNNRQRSDNGITEHHCGAGRISSRLLMHNASLYPLNMGASMKKIFIALLVGALGAGI